MPLHEQQVFSRALLTASSFRIAKHRLRRCAHIINSSFSELESARVLATRQCLREKKIPRARLVSTTVAFTRRGLPLGAVRAQPQAEREKRDRKSVNFRLSSSSQLRSEVHENGGPSAGSIRKRAQAGPASRMLRGLARPMPLLPLHRKRTRENEKSRLDPAYRQRGSRRYEWSIRDHPFLRRRAPYGESTLLTSRENASSGA